MNEAKVRRSTKSVVLEKAKVMSYEHIEEARAKRAVKEDTGARENMFGGARVIHQCQVPPEPKAKVARMSTAQVSEDETIVRRMENHCSVLQFGSVS